jgi:hypothetical protein
MKNTIRLSEQDLVRLVKKVVNEQMSDSPIPKDHPIFNPLWKEMLSNVKVKLWKQSNLFLEKC